MKDKNQTSFFESVNQVGTIKVIKPNSVGSLVDEKKVIEVTKPKPKPKPQSQSK